MKDAASGTRKDDTKKDLKWISLLLCFTDYAEELRFYLIHMTEVREMIVCVCVEEKEGEKEGKWGSNVNSLFCLWAGGAIDSGGNHITGKRQGLAESSNETVFSLCVCLRAVTHTTWVFFLIFYTIGNIETYRVKIMTWFLASNNTCNLGVEYEWLRLYTSKTLNCTADDLRGD